MLILAGAGSGKTRTITHKLAYLLEKGLCQPEEILAVTFTNKAAQEMRSRVSVLTAPRVEPPFVSTFHSFGARLLRRHAHRLDYGNNFVICDVDDQKRFLKQIYSDLGLRDEDVPVRKAQAVISHAKNRGWDPAAYKSNSFDLQSGEIATVFEKYQQSLKRANGMDFDDLILLSVRLLSEFEEVGRFYAGQFRYLLIDEYQDTNSPQYELIRLLTSIHQNITAVGDEDQSIYSFRGADIQNILRFEKDFPGAEIVKLEQNYRSTQAILSAATAVVSNNADRKDKRLWTETEGGEPIALFVAEDARQEAEFVAHQALARLQGGFSRIGVLYRTNFQSRQFEEAFRRLGVQYRLVGGVSFYRRKEVRDAVAFLRVAANSQDDISLLRIFNVPSRGIGAVTVERVLQLGRDHKTSIWEAIDRGLQERLFPARTHMALQKFQATIEKCSELLELPLHLAIRKILEVTGYIRWLDELDTEEAHDRKLNLDELITLARDYREEEAGLQDFLDHAALRSDADDYDESAPVTLMTLHNAKGLEFPVVFLAGLEEGLCPHSRSLAENDLEEERRLCYVGMTRAQNKLYLSYSRHRRFWGRSGNELSQPSRFLAEIPNQLVEIAGGFGYPRPAAAGKPSGFPGRKKTSTYSGPTYDSVESIQKFLGRRQSKGRHLKGGKGFVKGATVRHPSFGRGIILQVEAHRDDLKITAQFPGTGIKKLLQSYAHLKLE